MGELLLCYKLLQESFYLYIIHQILIQHILVFSFLLEKSIMDGVYVIFILVEHHLSSFFYFYILEEILKKRCNKKCTNQWPLRASAEGPNHIFVVPKMPSCTNMPVIASIARRPFANSEFKERFFFSGSVTGPNMPRKPFP